MTHNNNPANYLQNYQNYYQSAPEQYGDYYDENQDLKGNYDDDVRDLQVPNLRLYGEGYPEMTELYAGNAQFTESQQHVENTGMQFRQEYNIGPTEYDYNVPQHHHRNRIPKTHQTPLQSATSYRYTLPHSLYPSCPLATNHSLQGPAPNPEKNNYAPKAGPHNLHGLRKNIPQNVVAHNVQGVGENYNLQRYNDHQETYEDFDKRQIIACRTQENYEDLKQSQRLAYPSQENYGDYCTDTTVGYMADYGANQEMLVDNKGKKFGLYGNRIGRNGVLRKYPVTVKTPKYVSKNQVPQPIHKRPSALCLPGVTQPDPGLVKRKSKTHHHLKRTYDQSESLQLNLHEPTENYSYSAHQMHSEGDMNQKSMAQDLDNLLDQFENTVGSNKNQDTVDGEERDGMRENKIKELSKFLKPRVPPSIKAKQERITKMKSSLNMSSASLQPKMKVSLDKLLNRLQKCEISESGENISEKSLRGQKEEKEVKSNKGKNIEHSSVNYETLSRKLSPRMDVSEKSKTILDKPSTSLTTSLDNKKSLQIIKLLDDNCAIDLHRSKSYIVDLIDRALSKELGTIPRGQSLKDDMTPKRAVATISRHRQSCHKELCYEVTAALTDSFISNATAPQKEDDDPGFKLNDCDSKKLCPSYSDDVNYIKQLKQLRWGHIRHIQHEARKLADLEEFLEKCGEIEF